MKFINVLFENTYYVRIFRFFVFGAIQVLLYTFFLEIGPPPTPW